MNVLGISCFYHDSAAALYRDGKLTAAASEERFTRVKHDHSFPANAIDYCLKEGGIEDGRLDWIGFYDKPFIKFERILMTYLHCFPRGLRSFLRAMPLWMTQKLWLKHLLQKHLETDQDIVFTDHHQAHAASSFFASPFKEAAIITADGVGEWTTTSFGTGRDCKIELTHDIRFPHSLGLLYTAFTYYLGFKVNSAEYKVMGLAPYGEPKYVDLILDKLIDLKEDGSFRMNMDYFAYTYGLTMTNRRFEELFGQPTRESESELEQFHMDMARSVQEVTEEAMLRMTRHVHRETGMKNLCLAGGVGLNCVANGRIIRESPFEQLFVQPAAGDAGGALGVASFIHHCQLDQPRDFSFRMPYLGPGYDDDQIKQVLDDYGAKYTKLDREELIDVTARAIADKRVVGWFQGRMEFGPRALGCRSILADPRDPKMQDTVNLKIKFRESFRPFAPTVLEDRCSEYFDIDRETPYMLLVAQVHEDKRIIPSVTHVDGSARIQSIRRDDNPLYYDVISAFDKLSGVPVIINTSFNVRGEPIVCTPDDGYLCFMRTYMDDLVIGSYHLRKEDQEPLQEAEDWRKRFELD